MVPIETIHAPTVGASAPRKTPQLQDVGADDSALVWEVDE